MPLISSIDDDVVDGRTALYLIITIPEPPEAGNQPAPPEPVFAIPLEGSSPFGADPPPPRPPGKYVLIYLPPPPPPI